MESADLSKMMDEVRRSAFRLETLPQYLVPAEAEKFAAWRTGNPLPPRTPENNEWVAESQQIVARGIRWYRVHILDHPLSNYTRFELRSYLDSAAVGQQTYLADRHEHPELQDLHEDFWLLDDETAVRMVYDDEGHYLHPELLDDATPYLSIRDTAMACAEPLHDYLARTQVRLTV